VNTAGNHAGKSFHRFNLAVDKQAVGLRLWVEPKRASPISPFLLTLVEVSSHKQTVIRKEDSLEKPARAKCGPGRTYLWFFGDQE